MKAEATRRRFHIKGIEKVIPQFNGTAEAHLHISKADFIVKVVVAAPFKPDQVGQAIFGSLFEIALFQTLPALFFQAESIPQVVQDFCIDVGRMLLLHRIHLQSELY